MSSEFLPAKFPAKRSPPRRATNRFCGQDALQYQVVMSAFCCPPKIGRFGGLEVPLYQLVMPASQTPRLTTCVRFGGHTVGVNKKVAQEDVAEVAAQATAPSEQTVSITTRGNHHDGASRLSRRVGKSKFELEGRICLGAFTRGAITHGCRTCAPTSCAFIMGSWPRRFSQPRGSLGRSLFIGPRTRAS